MQALSADLRACVLDQRDFTRGGMVDDEASEARVMVDALLSLALFSRSWTADAQARLRRTIILVDSVDLATVIAAGIGPSLDTIIDVRDEHAWSDAAFGTLCELLSGDAMREYIGVWPRQRVGEEDDLEPRRCDPLSRIPYMHLRSSAARLQASCTMRSLQVDDWNGDGGTSGWPADAVLRELTRLDLNARDFADYADDASLTKIIQASRRLRKLTLWGVTLSELTHALLPATLDALQVLTLGLLPDVGYGKASSTRRARQLASTLAPRVRALRLGDSWTSDVGLRPLLRFHVLALANAWVAALPPAMAGRTSIHLCPSSAIELDADGSDDGAFVAIVHQCQALGVRCALAIGVPLSLEIGSDDRSGLRRACGRGSPSAALRAGGRWAVSADAATIRILHLSVLAH